MQRLCTGFRCRAVASSDAAKVGWPQRGFPTPNASDEPRVCRSFSVPSQADWLGLVAGCMDFLTEPTNWFINGDMTQEESAQAFIDIISNTFDLEESCAATEVPTPYWDEDSEVDDEESSETQVWYGTVSDPEAPPEELDFVENAAIFAFTGFLAAATWEVGFAPAILFHTIAPRFVLAIRRGDVGEIIRILVDGEEAARVDTSSASAGDVINVPIIADETIETGHDLVIVQVS